MYNSKEDKLTDMARVFLEPSNVAHRQYEALRAFYVDRVPSAEAAKRFGYTPGSFRMLCHQFLHDPQRCFFIEERQARHVPVERLQRSDTVQRRIIELRKQNLSVYDISDVLKREDQIKRSPAAVSLVLRQNGFAKLPRRRDEERPPGARVDAAEVADVRQLDLSERSFRTRFGGLFLFVPYLARLPFDAMMRKSGLPGTKMVPAGCAMRSLLALKLFGSARHSHVMSHVFDPGLGLFAGLNVIPKRSFLTEYSCRIDPGCHAVVMRRWFDAIGELGLQHGVSFDLDFHTIPFHGEEALTEKHYVSKRSRRQKGVLAFLARDAERPVFCYANADVRKEQQNDEILQFIKFWKARTGQLPRELVFDSKLTTYENLDTLNRKGIQFITLRRRTRKLLEEIAALPRSAWRRVELENVSRAYRTPRVVEQKVELEGYRGPVRQIAIEDLGHEQPTFLLTNQMRCSAAKLIGRYARRMLIENAIADGIDFFHMDALSSAVALKVNVDLLLTLMGSSLYRLLGAAIGSGYEVAKSRHIFRDFIEASATVSLTGRTVSVRFSKRAHNPLLLATGFDRTETPVPWWGGRRLCLAFG
jgi:hypothetical protein